MLLPVFMSCGKPFIGERRWFNTPFACPLTVGLQLIKHEIYRVQQIVSTGSDQPCTPLQNMYILSSAWSCRFWVLICLLNRKNVYQGQDWMQRSRRWIKQLVRLSSNRLCTQPFWDWRVSSSFSGATRNFYLIFRGIFYCFGKGSICLGHSLHFL